MDTEERRKLAMYESVQAVLSRHANTWNTYDPFAEAVPILDDNVDQIKAAALKQLRTTGGAQNKKEARQNLGEVAYFVASQTYAYATKVGNAELLAKVDYTPTSIVQGPEADVLTRCRDVYKAASENATALQRYKIDAAKLTELDEAISDFDTLTNAPRDAITKSAAATKLIHRLIPNTDELLKKTLDKLMVSFKKSAAVFFDEYKTARVIVDIGVKPEEKPAPPSPEPSPTATRSTKSASQPPSASP